MSPERSERRFRRSVHPKRSGPERPRIDSVNLPKRRRQQENGQQESFDRLMERAFSGLSEDEQAGFISGIYQGVDQTPFIDWLAQNNSKFGTQIIEILFRGVTSPVVIKQLNEARKNGNSASWLQEQVCESFKEGTATYIRERSKLN